MKKIKLVYIVALLLLTIGCSRKAVPTIPSVKTPCDSLIQSLLDSIQSEQPVIVSETIYKDGISDTICIVDSSDCSYYKIQALEIAGQYNQAIKERDYYKALSTSQARKITTNININSNNKRSQIGDDNISQAKVKGPAIVGDGNNTQVKPKAPVIIGDGNTVTEIKFNKWPWILVGAMGIITIQLAWKVGKNYIPGVNIAGVLSKFKFWS